MVENCKSFNYICLYSTWQLATQYNDEAKNGADINSRPEFQRLMKDAEHHKFDAVVVSKLDSFGRSVRDLVESLDKLKKS
ncbi:MAG: recombinase family protein [Candidatus Thermoplasmatota archaeon]|nr:recombinase family protein [Candidatus Thermoplasmatota archaeon]